MSRGSFSRAVARAAASGGSKNYRAARPTRWYALMAVIIATGLFLIAYSRWERMHPVAAKKAAVGPTATDNWNAAYAVDICGKLQPNLPANSNLSTVGIRTFGDGLININPGAVPKKADFEGKKATLGLFAKSYPNFTLTKTSLGLPGRKVLKNGAQCSGGNLTGPGKLQVKVWPTPTGTGVVVANPASQHLQNHQLITLAFVPQGASIPKPPSAADLSGASSSSTTSTAPASSSSTTSSSATTTTKPKS